LSKKLFLGLGVEYEKFGLRAAIFQKSKSLRYKKLRFKYAYFFLLLKTVRQTQFKTVVCLFDEPILGNSLFFIRQQIFLYMFAEV